MTYSFSTDFDKVNQNIGVSDDRSRLFFEKAKEVCFRAVMFDSSITDKSQAMEIYLNEVQPEGNVESFWAGCIFTDVFSQTENLAKHLGEEFEILFNSK